MTSASSPPAYSVLIARVSTEDRERILETLDALRRQDCDFELEVIVVDRLGDEVTRRIEKEHPAVRLLRCERGRTIPAMRAAALRAASGGIVAVTEDHCVPASNWLRSFDAMFRRHPQAAAVGGAVVNGITTTAFHCATFLCEYASAAPPLADGPCAELPGMNTAYARHVLAGMPQAALERGFWETTIHPRLRREAHLLVATNRAIVHHRKAFSLRLFIAQRFSYSVHFAGTRYTRAQWPLRLGAAMMSPLLPALFAIRLARVARRKPGMTQQVVRALPYLALFFVVCAMGECAGYLAGPGKALERIE